MATVRAALGEAMRALRSTGLGDSPTADELATGLEAAQTLVLEIHEGRGPLHELDVSGPFVAGENQRIRIVAGDVVEITLPNSVSRFRSWDPYDYGFAQTYAGLPPAGSTGPADGIAWRAPADGSRIEIVGTSQALYFYRADLNQWMPALGLTIDTELPFNNRLLGPFAAMLAERLVDVLSTAPQTSPALARRILAARTAMFTQAGRQHGRQAGEYL